MMPNRVVARYRDGRVVKGYTTDFLPTRDQFHIHSEEGSKSTATIIVAELKAIFFVRDLTGNPAQKDSKDFDAGRVVPGRRLRIRFQDGEILAGTSNTYHPTKSGFFLNPADPQSNIERCYVVKASIAEVTEL